MLKALALSLVLAQTPVIYFNINVPVTLSFQHDGNDGTGGVAKFRLTCGTVIYNWTDVQIASGKSTLADATGLFTYTLTYPGFSTFGLKSCSLTAYSSLLESLPSNTVQVPVAVPPNQPINFKVNMTLSATVGK